MVCPSLSLARVLILEIFADVVRADKPDEMLASDAKFISGRNPTMGQDSPANK